MYKYFATCPKGLESLLQDELITLGAQNVTVTLSGVSFSGDELIGIKACLWSRYASRILLKLITYYAGSDLEFYMGAYGIKFEEYFDVNSSFMVTFNGQNNFIRHTNYGALRIKDAICDRFVKYFDKRPNVNKDNPNVRINAHLDKKNNVTISLDLSGSPLHRRDYRELQGVAPLKENLAAAIVSRSGYSGGNVLDPMCGSGTLVIEAAMKAANVAPGLFRHKFGFLGLKNFKYSDYLSEKEKAQQIAKDGVFRLKQANVSFLGFDNDIKVIEKARENAKRAGVDELVSFECRDLENLTNPITNKSNGIVLCNPPYGERLGNFAQLLKVYTTLGMKLKEHFKGYKAAIISSNEELLSCLRLRPEKTYKLFNGALPCQLRVFELKTLQAQDKLDISNPEILTEKTDSSIISDNAIAKQENQIHSNSPEKNISSESNNKVLVAQEFANRLVKNLKHIDKWAKKEGLEAYRIYDADLPNYSAAIDRYGEYIVINEYKAPRNIPEYLARQRFLDMIQAVVEVTKVDGEKVILKVRERKKGDSQYEKLDDSKHTLLVKEYGAVFIVNLWDYLDTGLFLDHRLTRKMIMNESKGKDFLNVFAYTGSATVYAALGGANTTTTVDMSRTYLTWAKDNLKANNISPINHQFIQANCLEWIKTTTQKYDLIFVDPPTFSNSKRMQDSFDVQRDHVNLLKDLSAILRDDGKIIFSNNNRNFNMDKDALEQLGLTVEDITAKTIPQDFKRNNKIHNCWIVKKENKLQE